MEIKTKFSVGDKVWFIGDGCIDSAYIDYIKTYTDMKHTTVRYYGFQEIKEHLEESLFPTKEALLQSL
jgi:hypothetical protein